MTCGKRIWVRGTALLVTVAVLAGCLVTTDVELADMVGDWDASQARFAEPGNLNNTCQGSQPNRPASPVIPRSVTMILFTVKS